MESKENWKKTFTIILVVSISVGVFTAIKVDGPNIFSDIAFGFCSFFLATVALSSCFMQASGQGR